MSDADDKELLELLTNFKHSPIDQAVIDAVERLQAENVDLTRLLKEEIDAHLDQLDQLEERNAAQAERIAELEAALKEVHDTLEKDGRFPNAVPEIAEVLYPQESNDDL